jgi:glutaredoxin
MIESFSVNDFVQDADYNISDYTGTQTKLPKILLNGNNVCMVRDPIISLFVVHRFSLRNTVN